MDYNYPLRIDWNTEEIVTVMAFYTAVEKAYEVGIGRTDLMAAYRSFKEIVPSMSEEKTIFKEFKEVSGYESYDVIKSAKESADTDKIKGKQR